MHELPYDPLEYANWKDTGCDLYPSCLRCPLPHCIEEQPRGRQRQRLGLRSSAMALMKSSGATMGQIAARFEVSVRTVQRALNGHIYINKR